MCVSVCGSLKAQARLHEVVLEGFDSCSGRQQVPWKGKTTRIWLGATVLEDRPPAVSLWHKGIFSRQHVAKV